VILFGSVSRTKGGTARPTEPQPSGVSPDFTFGFGTGVVYTVAVQSDAELLRLYSREGSQAAFAELTKRHVHLVFGSALRRLDGNQALAEDVAQQVFIQLARRAEDLSRHPALPGWLYTATRNASINAAKAEHRRRMREKEAMNIERFSSQTEAVDESQRLRPILDRQIDGLSEKERIAVILRFFEGRQFPDIAQRLSISEDAARRRVGRGLDKMRKHLQRLGFRSTAGALGAFLTEEGIRAAPAATVARLTQAGLASSLAPATMPLGLLKFMSKTKISIGAAAILGITAALFIPAVGIAIHEFRAAHSAEAESARLKRDTEAKEQELAQLRKAVAAAERNLAEARPHAGTASAKIGRGAHGMPGRPATARNSRLDAAQFLTQFPQARSLLAATFRGYINFFYASFFRQAGLTPVQIEQFENAADESLFRTVTITPTGVGSPPIWNLVSADQLNDFLSPQAVQQFEDYNRAATAYHLVGGMAAEVGLAAPPLSVGQIDQLTQIVAKNSSDYQSGGQLDLTGSGQVSINWNTVRIQAQAVATPAQWPAMESVLDEAIYGQMVAAVQTQSSSQQAAGSP